MNSQWKLVPVEPTETMVINGFESVPDECFTDEEVWEQYQGMSGCQQAAFRAKLCWAAMISSSPTSPEEDAQPVMKLEAERLWGGAGEYVVSFVKPGWLDECRKIGGEFLLYTHPDASKVARLTAERDALQQRLNAADQRIDELGQSKELLREAYNEASPRLPYRIRQKIEQFFDGLVVSMSQDAEVAPIKGMIEARGGEYAIMIDENNGHYGWTFRKDSNGMWVSGRKATDAEMQAARQYARHTNQQ